MKNLTPILIALCLSGCSTTADFLSQPGVYGCVDAHGSFTHAGGRLIKIPPDMEVTESLINTLCP